MVIETARLLIVPLTHAALQAWVDLDGGRLTRETGAAFPDPPEPPPLFGADLSGFRDRMAETPDELGWWAWLVLRRDDAVAVGVCGLGGPPGPGGTVAMGYSVYPRLEGRGYATEAARAVMEWALARPGVRCVRATVPLWNAGSIAVARKLGMSAVGTDSHPEAGEVAVYERRIESLEGDPPAGP